MKRFFVIYVLFWAIMLAGYVQCVYKLCKCDFEPSYKAKVIYGIGTFSGLGCIIGWFDIGK